MARLRVHEGKTVLLDGFFGGWPLKITPAGLFEESADGAEPHLRVKVATPGPLDLVNTVLRGARPRVSIEGDADLAAVFAWLAENLRWDYEEDFSRLAGDAPAHFVGQRLRVLGEMLRGVFSALRKRDHGAP